MSVFRPERSTPLLSSFQLHREADDTVLDRCHTADDARQRLAADFHRRLAAHGDAVAVRVAIRR